MSRPKILISRSRFFLPGGLDSRDESRQTFKTCQDFLDCRNKLFFVSVKIFKIETFQLRLCLVEVFVKIVETNRDCQDFLRRIEICQEILTLWRHFEYENDKV
jgi:hypothetical protein